MKALVYFLLRVPNYLLSVSTPDWGRRPTFYDLARTRPELLLLEERFDIVKRECAEVVRLLGRIPMYPEIDPMQTRIGTGEGPAQQWKVYFLEAMGRKAVRNCLHCPETARMVSAVPDVFQCCFSILEGGKSIPSHRSPYWGYLRYHLGVEVPNLNPPKMRVGDAWVGWEEGKGFIFDDTLEHEIRNETTQLRIVLIVDFPRPTGRLGRCVHRCATWLMKHTYARRLIGRGELLD